LTTAPDTLDISEGEEMDEAGTTSEAPKAATGSILPPVKFRETPKEITNVCVFEGITKEGVWDEIQRLRDNNLATDKRPDKPQTLYDKDVQKIRAFMAEADRRVFTSKYRFNAEWQADQDSIKQQDLKPPQSISIDLKPQAIETKPPEDKSANQEKSAASKILEDKGKGFVKEFLKSGCTEKAAHMLKCLKSGEHEMELECSSTVDEFWSLIAIVKFV